MQSIYHVGDINMDSVCLSSLCVLAPFAMELNVSKNLSTGESTVVSNAAVPPEEIHQHSGVKVYNDSSKFVYALNSQEVLYLV